MEDPVRLSEQFAARVFGNGAELVVHPCDDPLRVGHGHDGVGVKCSRQLRNFAYRLQQLLVNAFALSCVVEDDHHPNHVALRRALRHHAGLR